MSQGLILLSLIAWILWLSVVCDKGQDPTQNWRRWSHIQWAAGATIVLASPSWQFTLLFLVLCLSYWLPWVESKSGSLNDWFIKVFLFAAFYVIATGKIERWMFPWVLFFVFVCGCSVAFWIAMVKIKGPKYSLNIFGRKFSSFEFWPDRDEPTPGGFNCHGRMMNSVHSGAFGSVCFFASLGLGAIWHPVWFLSAVIGAFIMWGSGSRGAALNVLVGAVLWIASGGPHAYLIGAMVLACGLLASYKKIRDWSWGSNISSWRFQVWRDSIKICLGNPFKSLESILWWAIGTGPFGWQTLAGKNIQKYGDRPWLSPHNEYVHILCEHGLLGMFASMIFIWSVTGPSFRSVDNYGSAYLGVAGTVLATAIWSFPWRGTALVEGTTGRFLNGGILKGQNGKENKILVPEIQFSSAGAPIFTWITAIWASIGPLMG